MLNSGRKLMLRFMEGVPSSPRKAWRTLWSSVLLLETRRSSSPFGAEFRRPPPFFFLPSPGAIMNHKASAMETWNVIACGTSSRPWEIPKVEAMAGAGERRGAPGSRCASPRTCAPPAAPPACGLCFFHAGPGPHFAARRPPPAWAAAGNQAAQPTRRTALPELRRPPETTASGSRTR